MDSRRAWTIYSSLLCGTFVTMEAAAFQAPAIPSITRHFGIPVSLAALIMLLYFIALTVFAPIAGRLADQIGRRRMVLTGLMVFAAAEFLAAASPNFVTLLVARFFQGIGVASILPVVFGYVGWLFPEEERGTALGMLIFTTSMGATSGGLIGGLMIDHFGWRSVYWASGALAIVGMLPVIMTVPEVRSDTARSPFDYRGAFSLFVAISAALSMPIWADNVGLASPFTLIVAAAGLLGLAALWVGSSRAEAPVVDVDVLRQRSFALPSIIYWLHILVFSGFVYALAFFLNDRPGGNATQAGSVLMVLYGSCMLMAPIAGRLVDRMEARMVMISAVSATVLAMVLLTRVHVDSPLWYVMLTAGLLGLTMGANTPAVMKVTIGSIPKHKMGAGTGMISMLKDLGTPMGSSCSLAVFGSVLATQSESVAWAHVRAQGLAEHVQKSIVDAMGKRGARVPAGIDAQLYELGIDVDVLVRLIRNEALSSAMASVGYMLTGVALVALASCFLLPRVRRPCMPRKSNTITPAQ